jgi:hypothetical protein
LDESLVLSSSTSFADSAAAAEALLVLDAREARGALVVVELGPWALADDRRFLASATAPVPAGFETVRVTGAAVLDPALAELVVLATAGFGDEVLAPAPAGLRAAAVVEAVLPTALFSEALLGDEVALLGTADVRRAVVEDVEVRFFSSSETDGWLRCDIVDADVGGRLAAVETEPGGGRVGGLLRPLAGVAFREAALAVGFVAAPPAVGTRRAGADVVAGAFFGAVELVGAGLAELDSAAGSGAGASVCCTTSKSASDMIRSRAPCGRRSRVISYGAEALMKVAQVSNGAPETWTDILLQVSAA